MANSFAGIEIGKRSLMAHASQIQTAGHNIANADTEGYSRQRVIVKAFEPIYRPDLSREQVPGQIGQGSVAESVERIRDELLEARIVEQGNLESFWETRDKYCSMLESVYNEPGGVSVRTNMDKFWDAWQELSMYPESDASRQAVVVRGETLADSVRQQYRSLRSIADQIDGDIRAVVRQANELARQISDLNDQIVRSQAMGDNPNDLMDRRDLLVAKLSSLVNVTVSQNDEDEFMVHTDGQIFVQGSLARQIDIEGDASNNGYARLSWADTKIEAHFEGGTLGALVALRDKDVRGEIQSLNSMALSFADLVNDVHRAASGKSGSTGLDFFVRHDFIENATGSYDRDGDGAEDSTYVFRITGSNALSAQAQIGLEGTLRLSSAEGTTDVRYFATDTVEDLIARINDSPSEVKAYLDREGHLALKGAPASDTQNPDFVIRHVEDSGRFLTGYAGLLAASGEDGAFDFNRADAVATLTTERFSVAPVANPAAYIAVEKAITGDVSNVAAGFAGMKGYAEAGDGTAASQIAAIRNTAVMIGKQKTFDDYFADAVTNIALKGEQAQNQLESQSRIMGDLRALRDSISGVNIDEELADIIKFQHGYNVAAKFISVQDELLDVLMNRLGV